MIYTAVIPSIRKSRRLRYGDRCREGGRHLIRLCFAPLFFVACSAIAQSGPNPELTQIVHGLEDKDPSVRSKATDELENPKVDVGPALPALLHLLRSEKLYVRSASADALGGLGSKIDARTIDDLVGMVHERQNPAFVRASAANALGQIGPPTAERAISRLVESTKDPDPAVRYSAIDALRQIAPTETSAVSAVAKALRVDEEPYVRRCAAEALGDEDIAPAIAISALVSALADSEYSVRASAAETLGSLGKASSISIPDLERLLQDSRGPYVRSSAADALGDLGFQARSAIKPLTGQLSAEDPYVRKSAAVAIGKVAEALSDKPEALRKPEDLTNALNDLAGTEAPLAKLPLSQDFTAPMREAILGHVNDARSKIQGEALRRQLHGIASWIKRNKATWPAIVWLALTCSIWASLYIVSPLWVLWVAGKLTFLERLDLPPPLKQMKEGVSYLLGVGFFQYHDKVLDAWIEKHSDSAREKLNSLRTFDENRIYVNVPLAFGGTSKLPRPADFHDAFNYKSSVLLVQGEGGSGKTALACRLALWALGKGGQERLCRAYRMMPVFIEANIPGSKAGDSSALLKQIGVQLQGLTSEEKSPPDEMIRSLLRKRRILLIVDGLSERDESTRQTILSGDPAVPINALLITSRDLESPNASRLTVVKTSKLEGQCIAAFIEDYIAEAGKRGYFTDASFYGEIKRFTDLVDDQEVTPMLAGLYARYMMESAEKATIDRPRNIPELMDSYVAEMAHKGDNPAFSTYMVQRLARKIAWSCLRHRLRPAETPLSEIVTALSQVEDGIATPFGLSDPEATVNYFVDQLRLLERRGAAEDNVKFFLDPISEYLAARYLVAHGIRSDAAKWSAFFSEMQARNDQGNSVLGFVRALADVIQTKGEEENLPSTVLGDLRSRFAVTAAPTSGEGNGNGRTA